MFSRQTLKGMQSKLCSTIIIFLTVGVIGLSLARPTQASTVGSVNTTAAYEFGSYRVPANSTHTFTRYFRAGEFVSVAVEGDRTTDLDVYVYDPFGRRVATDDDYTDQCFVYFSVQISGAYTIKVVNRGRVYNDYDILFDRE